MTLNTYTELCNIKKKEKKKKEKKKYEYKIKLL